MSNNEGRGNRRRHGLWRVKLYETREQLSHREKSTLLLRIISGVSKDARVNPSLNPVPAHNHDPVGVRMQELVVEQKLPDGVHELPATMRKNFALLGPPLGVKLGDLVLDSVRELRIGFELQSRRKTMDTY